MIDLLARRNSILFLTLLIFASDAVSGNSSIKEALSQGRAYLESGQINQAVSAFKKAISYDPRCAEAHMLLGYAYRAGGAYELLGEAKAELRQALALDPNLIWARFYLARIYLDLGRLNKAEEQLLQMLQTRPEVPHALSLLGEVNRQLGKPELSVRHHKRALEIEPSLVSGHYYLGLAYLDLENDAQALKELEIASNSPDAIPEIHISLGSLYLAQGDLDRAVEILKNAIQLDPSRADGHLKLARAYRLKGQTDLAEKELQLLLGRENTFLDSPYFQKLRAELYLEMGIIREDQGKISEARQAYSEALALYPGYEEARRHLAGLHNRED
ncbi:MAG: tetratricopeptide repeat protein [Acidobacteriota bacterium]